MMGSMMASSTMTGMMRIKHSANASTTSVSTVTGAVASVSGSTISLTATGGTYTVDATNAKILRKYGATMTVADMQTGDSLSVVGTVSGTSITAKTIRDNSQQQKNGTFSGTVSSVSGSSFVLASKQRGNQTINTDSTTKFKESGQTSVSMSNVAVGENITTSGLWDSTNSTVAATNVTIVVKNEYVTGTLTAINGTSLTLTASTSSATVYTVDASNIKKVLRRYGADTTLSALQIGDTLQVRGIVNVDNVTASTIRDMSLQARSGTFTGTLSAINGTSFTLQSKDRGAQTINTTASTTFRLGTASTSMSSLAVGQTVTLSGVWDRTNSNVTATRVTIKVASTNVSGTLESVSGTTLTVMASTTAATTYTVDASKAVVSYKNGRKGAISILQTNDQVTVRGQMVSGSTDITASSVRDLSQTYKAPVSTPTTNSASSAATPPANQ